MAGQLTLAMIKPHCVLNRQVGRILTRVEDQGFAIVLAKMAQLHSLGAQEFYKEHKGKPFYDNLCKTMSASPVWVLVLAKPNAVEEWRSFIGATNPVEAAEGTLRREFGDLQNMTNNAVHGSATDHAAKREINFFFGREIKLAEKLNAPDNQ